MVEYTLSIIKPDAVSKGYIGAIIDRFEKAGLKIAAAKMMRLTKSEAEAFYAVHRGKSFYPSLVEFMSSGAIFVQVLAGENAILHHREIMGATNPENALQHTIRADFAESTSRNAVHGSDSQETAAQEIAFFFKPAEIVNG